MIKNDPGSVQSNFKKIVWLASYPKSGNTWIRAFITAYFMKEKELDLEKILPFSDTNEDAWKRFCPINMADLTCEDFTTIKPMIIMRMLVEENNKNKILMKTHDAKYRYFASLFDSCNVYIRCNLYYSRSKRYSDFLSSSLQYNNT